MLKSCPPQGDDLRSPDAASPQQNKDQPSGERTNQQARQKTLTNDPSTSPPVEPNKEDVGRPTPIGLRPKKSHPFLPNRHEDDSATPTHFIRKCIFLEQDSCAYYL